MKIAAIHVEGYGTLGARSLGMDRPFVLIHGSNEAGKSTLTSFIRAILFGFAARGQTDQRIAERYEPPAGGAFGGSLTLIDEQGQQFLVERYDLVGNGRVRSSAGVVKVTYPDGRVGGEEELSQLLGGISGELFRVLFAFGLTELQELRTLQKEEIGGYLYSAGLGISPSAMIEGERKLTSRMERLFKPRGKNQEINLQLKALEDLESSIRRSKDLITQYDAMKEEERSAAIQIQQLEEERSKLLTQHTWLETCMKARESWMRLQSVESELADLPDWPHFPDQAVSRYEALAEEQERLTTAYKECQLITEQLDALIEQLTLNEELMEHKSNIESLLERVVHYQADLRSVDELKVEIAQSEKELQRTLRLIDSEWSEASLEAFPVSAATREQINHFKQRMEELSREQAQLAMEERTIIGQKEQLEEERLKLAELIRENDGGSAYNKNALIANQGVDPIQHLRSIAGLYADYKLLEQECDHIRQRILDRELQQMLTSQIAEQKDQPANNSWIAATISVATIGILGSVLLFMQGNVGFALTLLGAGIIGAAGTAVMNRKSVKAEKKVKGRRGREITWQDSPALDPLSALRNKLDQIERELFTIQDRLQDQVYGYWQMSNGSSSSVEYTWQTAKRWLSEQLESCQRAAQEQIKTAELERAYELIDKQMDKLSSRKHAIADELAEANASWSEWLSRQGFSKPLSPHALEGSLPLVEQGHSLLHQLHRLAARLAAAEITAAAFEAAAAGLPGSASAAADPILGVKRQGEALALELRKREDAARAAEERRAAELKALSLRQRLDHHQLRIAELMAEAHAESEQGLRVNARLASRRAELDGERRHLLPALTALVHGSQRLQELDAMLAQHGESELAARADELTQQLARVTREVNELRERRGLLAGEAAKLEQGAEHSDKLQRREEQLASLQQAGREYAVHAFALHLLRKAREVYERERQPGVLKRASGYFARMTRNKYIGIRAPFASDQKLEAVRPDGRGVDTAYLSRGTAEQLYLAMRFALAEEYATRVNLPLIMDDILVNFDDDRMEACLEVLNELSLHHQIILFTCHKHVRDATLRKLPELQVVEL
jgi:uncharacterized protein YhaN